MNNDVKSLLESFFGEKAKVGSTNYFFHCPRCNHHKRKLLIQKETYQWHCWICEDTNSTKGRSLYSLFKFFNASQYYINEAVKIEKRKPRINLDDKKDLFDEHVSDNDVKENIYLPKGFIPLYKETYIEHPSYKRAIYYLEQRNIRLIDIIRYEIGYCKDGEYSDRIIIPSYDKFYRLNYFIARSFYKDHSLKYKNPTVDKTKIIYFESFLNWSLPITIVEGAFDAIPCRYNVTSLLGSSLNEDHRLMNEILLKHPPQINLILDKDAISKALIISEILLNNDINTKLIILKDDRDPNELGFNYIYNIIKETQMLSFESLMKIKLNL